MEYEYAAPEEFMSHFRSKKDLYDLLSIDNELLLPSYSKCPIHFLRQLFNNEKQVLKTWEVVQIKVPQYHELSPSKRWEMVKEYSDLLGYFSDMKEGQTQERDFLFNVLSTLRTKEMRDLVQSARKNRSIPNKSDKEDLIEVHPDIKTKILGMLPMKTSKGKAYHLLKKGAKLIQERRPAKKYPANFGAFKKKEEEKYEDEEG